MDKYVCTYALQNSQLRVNEMIVTTDRELYRRFHVVIYTFKLQYKITDNENK